MSQGYDIDAFVTNTNDCCVDVGGFQIWRPELGKNYEIHFVSSFGV